MACTSRCEMYLVYCDKTTEPEITDFVYLFDFYMTKWLRVCVAKKQ